MRRTVNGFCSQPKCTLLFLPKLRVVLIIVRNDDARTLLAEAIAPLHHTLWDSFASLIHDYEDMRSVTFEMVHNEYFTRASLIAETSEPYHPSQGSDAIHAVAKFGTNNFAHELHAKSHDLRSMLQTWLPRAKSDLYKSLRCLVRFGHDETNDSYSYQQVVVTLFRTQSESPPEIKMFKHVETTVGLEYTNAVPDFQRLRICGLLWRGDHEAGQTRCEEESRWMIATTGGDRSNIDLVEVPDDEDEDVSRHWTISHK